MRRFRWLAVVVSLAVGGCGPQGSGDKQQTDKEQSPAKVTSEDVQREVDEAADAVGQYMWQTKEATEKALADRMAKLETETAELRAKGAELSEDAKVAWDEKMVELEAKRKALGEKLAELKASSAEAWKEMQTGISEAWKDLDAAMKRAASEFE